MLKTFHKEKFVLLIVLNCITYFSNAQCPDVSKINQEFRKYNQQNISISTYTKWLYQWEDCRFPIDSLYGFIHSKVGERYYLDQDFVLAKTHFEKSLAVFKKYDTKVSYIPKSLSIIGRCYYYLKDYKQAKK